MRCGKSLSRLERCMMCLVECHNPLRSYEQANGNNENA